jgi:uncharacterized delta-60 repeat protein
VHKESRFHLTCANGVAAIAVLAVAAVIFPAGARASGELDPSFGTHGVARTDVEVGGHHMAARAVAIDSQGRIVAAGDYALARFRPNGAVDRSFSGDGKRTIGIRVMGVAIDSQDRVVIAGFRGPIDDEDFALARFTTDGSLDPSFGTNGKVITNFGPAHEDYAYSLAIDSEGRIVAAGASAVPGSGGYHYRFALARYLPDGSLDDSFDGDGLQTTDAGGYNSYATAIAIDSRDRIVAAGEKDVLIDGSGYARIAVGRYTAAGRLDAGFSGDGIVTTGFPQPADSDGASSVAVDGNGRIVVGGNVATTEDAKFALARFTPGGNLDPSFDTDGRLITSFGQNDEVATSVATAARGRIVAAGISGDRIPGQRTSNKYFALARYRADGSLDPSFSRDGKQTGPRGRAFAAVIDSSDRIVAAGASLGQIAVARYLDH